MFVDLSYKVDCGNLQHKCSNLYAGWMNAETIVASNIFGKCLCTKVGSIITGRDILQRLGGIRKHPESVQGWYRKVIEKW